MSLSISLHNANQGFGGIIDYCKMLPCIEELYGILSDKAFPISQKDAEQVLIDIIRGFFGVGRKDGTHYINHLIQTLKNTKKYDESFDHDSVLIALLHDSIEDTEENFESIKLKYGINVALGVQVLSKKPFWKYIPEWNNENNLGSNEIKDFLKIKTGIESHIGKEIDHDFKLSNYSQLPDDLRLNWEYYEKKYKKIRNEDYFTKFQDLKSLRHNIEEEAKTRGIDISEGELELLTHKVATVKLADRLHNIVTLPHEKIEGKTNETVMYLKKIGRELGGGIWSRIAKEMFRLVSIHNREAVIGITGST